MTAFLKSGLASLIGRWRIILAAIGLVVLVVGPTIALAVIHYSARTGSTRTTKATQEPHASKGTDATRQHQTSNPAQDKTSSNALTSPAVTNAACKLLSLSLAQKILGATAQASSPDSNATPPQTIDTTTTACAYANTAGIVELTVRIPKDSLGTSENAVAFGSEKPAGVTDVHGYGQAAYWDSGKSQLDILGSNNWYIISRSQGAQASTLDDAKAVANVLVAEF